TLAQDTVSDSCPFCGNLLVISAESQKKQLKPKSLLPFKIEQKEAFNSFQKWIKKLWFTPSGFKKMARVNEKIVGMYIPYWTYDSDTSSDYVGERGDEYTTTETYTDSSGKKQTRNVTRVRWTRVRGNVKIFFDDVLIVASESLPRGIVDRLEPWDVKDLIPYDEKFLSGFRTESYQLGVKDGFEKAKIKMDDFIRTQIRKDIGGDRQSIKSVDTEYSNKTFKHILLPIWIRAYKYKNKSYRFLINGRTGQVSGQRPYSWLKITGTILLIIGIIALIWWLTN
ncbi:MAG: hypothetical protein GX879_03150, partial [Bacteroidales bacterium]|nr:hypothetical protein [Bacteroidales bacterium]